MIDSSLQLHRHGANLFLQSALRHQSGTLNFPNRHCRKSKRNGGAIYCIVRLSESLAVGDCLPRRFNIRPQAGIPCSDCPCSKY